MAKPSQFLQKHRSNLIEKLEKYLLDTLSHEEIQQYAWKVIETGKKLSSTDPYEAGEEVFWATIWALQHLADDDHMNVDTTKTELSTLFSLLRNGGSLPEGWVGKRP